VLAHHLLYFSSTRVAGEIHSYALLAAGTRKKVPYPSFSNAWCN